MLKIILSSESFFLIEKEEIEIAKGFIHSFMLPIVMFFVFRESLAIFASVAYLIIPSLMYSFNRVNTLAGEVFFSIVKGYLILLITMALITLILIVT